MPIKKTKLSTPINKIEIINQNVLKNKISDQIKEAYRDYKYFSCVLEIINFLGRIDNICLSEINILIIKFLSSKLSIDNTQFIKSSDLNIKGKRTERVVSILNEVSASQYISPPGSKDYLSKDKYDLNTNIPISFIDYNLKKYSQKKNLNFISNLSIIDVIANIGWSGTSDYVKL